MPNYGVILINQEIDSRTSATMIADIRKSCGPKVEILFKSECSCELTPLNLLINLKNLILMILIVFLK